MNDAKEDPRLAALSTLVQLQAEARRAETPAELTFIAVNETHRLVPYQQAAHWRQPLAGRPRIETVSGVSQVDRNAPYVAWLGEVVGHFAAQHDARRAHRVAVDRIEDRFRDGWAEWSAGHGLWCPWVGPGDELIGSLWLTRDTDWTDGEIALLDQLNAAYAHAAAFLGERHRRSLRAQVALAAVLLGIALLPVRLSVLVPAEVVAEDPIIVAAPVEGVIKRIHVRPNEKVQTGQPLFSLDDTTISSRHEVARHSLDVARAEYMRAAQKAFQDDPSRAELARLSAIVREKDAEVEYTARLLQRIHVAAERDGIVVYGDPNDWLGKPVVVGERVMTLADPERTELQAWVPVADAISMAGGAPARFFLNTDPTRSLAASVYQSSFEAELTPEQVLAFRVRARFDVPDHRPRLGLKGTAKLYGERVSFIFYLMRRPLAAVRQFLGW